MDQKRLDKSKAARDNFLKQISRLEQKIDSRLVKISEKERARKEIATIKEVQLKAVEDDISDIQGRMKDRSKSGEQTMVPTSSSQMPGESEHDYLVRTGKITPFANTAQFKTDDTVSANRSHQVLTAPGQELEDINEETEDEMPTRIPKKNVRKRKRDDDTTDSEEYAPSENDETSEEEEVVDEPSEDTAKIVDITAMDDGNQSYYNARLEKWIKKRRVYRTQATGQAAEESDERFMPHPVHPDAVINDTFRVPGDIYSNLFDYQRTGVQWLWELFTQKAGGIIGDEMGLGKTVQITAFLAGLYYSGKLDKPALIVCPATVMKQWVNEFHRWWPPLRTVILHSIGSGMDISKEEVLENTFESISPDEDLPTTASVKSRAAAKSIVDSVVEKGHVLVTTYAGMNIYRQFLLDKEWGYCVLDEGHKIRNPDSTISLTCKQIRTPNRIILSGTPIQNNLTELWSLFDFVFPGRLGTLPVFQNQFAVPINIGGYANATNVQVQTAYKCAVVLRDIVSPYLLRRMKVDVAADLPRKTEKVLFCKLTKHQRQKYQDFLKSDEMKSIFSGKRQVLFGVDILRKICNHPDLADRKMNLARPDFNYGSPAKSGKMQVVKALIQLWMSQGHRTLLFAQTKQMLDILQTFMTKIDGVKFLRMDGSTPIAQRQTLVDRYNNDTSLNVFLLTTRVGGLGVNLTGADRVIIYDPDWNPSTDVQARERAWRLGQKRDVTIYRLMTAGTIEEKIYHRQIFKQFLTNKILKDPKQRRFFKMNDLYDLFSLGDQDEEGTETGGLFDGTEMSVKQDAKPKKSKKKNNEDDLAQLMGMNGVAGLTDYNDQSEEKSKSSGDQDEDRILNDLFSSSGVHSTLEHDAIMDASRPDTIIVEKEASRIATAAANALRESRKAARKAEIGTPTWTGRFGSAGRFNSRPNSRSGTQSPTPGPLSSSSVLQSIRHRKELESKANAASSKMIDEQGAPNLVTASQRERVILLEKMKNYISEQPGNQASSSAIAKNCKIKITDAQEVATIRQMLKQIADWVPETSQWLLKEEFR